MLTREDTRENCSTYLEQFGKILDIDKVEVRYNSEWMDKTDFNYV
jgi:tyrosyl-tRNA synthetase